jgi:tripartite-type tricarboxylate transporter receptor subunit TctC
MAQEKPVVRRRALLQGVVAASACAGAAHAQAIAGGKPVAIILPYGPSGGQEVLSRILIDAFTERFGGTFVTDHRPGAGTTLAARYVARSRPDGTTLFLATNVTFAQAQFAFRNPGYDPDADFAHISLLAEALYFMAAHPRWESLEALVAEARRRPGQLAYTSWGIGSVAHLLGVDLCRREGIDMIHVPFNGSPPALMEVVAGRADVIFSTLSTCLPHVEANRLRALATPSPQRIPAFPEVKTMVELGYQDFVTLPWFSLSAPANTPPALLAEIEEATIAALGTETARRKLAELGLVPAAQGSAAMRARIVRERAINKNLMTQAGVEPQ